VFRGVVAHFLDGSHAALASVVSVSPGSTLPAEMRMVLAPSLALYSILLFRDRTGFDRQILGFLSRHTVSCRKRS
jgi:hypothetical protein